MKGGKCQWERSLFKNVMDQTQTPSLKEARDCHHRATLYKYIYVYAKHIIETSCSLQRQLLQYRVQSFSKACTNVPLTHYIHGDIGYAMIIYDILHLVYVTTA